uniref:Uncharacterized protein n=1 Tax=Anguilla anguilla TaxID=7936 RepID=A0A0E9QDP7_ANGAN
MWESGASSKKTKSNMAVLSMLAVRCELLLLKFFHDPASGLQNHSKVHPP